MDNETKERLKSLEMVGLAECTLYPDHRHVITAKKLVVDYLRSNELVLMCAGWMTDVFTEKQAPGWRPNYRADDSYTWNESIAYYLDKYDAELPPVFLAHIYNEIGVEERRTSAGGGLRGA